MVRIHPLQMRKSAVLMRESGFSFRVIEKKLGIPRSTLSGWMKSVYLSKSQRLILDQNRLDGLMKARMSAVKVNKANKITRLKKAEKDAESVLKSLDLTDKNVLKLALSMFFLGEGFKIAEETSLGNSDPISMKAFLKLLDLLYGVNKKRLRVYLHLRADQNSQKELRFWSNLLELDQEYFKIAPIDKRTVGKPTYKNYHGVCVIRYYDISIKRELLELSKKFLVTV